jgi:hypothetical protein
MDTTRHDSAESHDFAKSSGLPRQNTSSQRHSINNTNKRGVSQSETPLCIQFLNHES